MKTPSLYLAIDQGGHASRALVFAADGRVQASAFRDIDTRYPGDERVEHDPEQVASSIREAIDEVLRVLGREAVAIKAAGLAIQRSSLVCWDKLTGEALSPVISWQDRRAAGLMATLAEKRGEIRRLTGLYPNPHYGASKMRWCLEQLPQVRQALADQRLTVGPLSSFLLFRLLRERPSLVDPANGSRTLLLNQQAGDWDSGLLQLFGIPARVLPRPVATRHDFGHLAGIDENIPLTICTGDQSAALFAYGMPQPGAAYINAGSGAFIQTLVPEQVGGCDERLLRSTVYRDQKLKLDVLEGTVNGAALALKWWRERYQVENAEAKLEAWLAKDIEPPIFINGVAGVGSPFWLSSLEPRFEGEGNCGGEAVAVLESIVFLLRANLDCLRACVGLQAIELSGGLAASEGFCQRLADVAGLPVRRSEDLEATARGLGYLLADFPEGWGGDAPASEFQPQSNSALQSRYRRWHERMQQCAGEMASR